MFIHYDRRVFHVANKAGFSFPFPPCFAPTHRETGGDAGAWEERGNVHTSSQSLLHGADQAVAEPVSRKCSLSSRSALCGRGSQTYVIFCPCSASDNIPKADEIRTLIKDIWDTRIAKLRLSTDSFISQQEAHAKVKRTWVLAELLDDQSV